jgi:hypothetical protein
MRASLRLTSGLAKLLCQDRQNEIQRQGMRATMKSFQSQSPPLQESSQKMRYIMPFRRGRAAIAFAFSGRCSWKFAGLLPLVCRLVDIGMREPIPISRLAGEVMAAGIGVGSGGRIRVI